MQGGELSREKCLSLMEWVEEFAWGNHWPGTHSLFLLQVENPGNHPKPDPENFSQGFTLIPHPFHVKLVSRS